MSGKLMRLVGNSMVRYGEVLSAWLTQGKWAVIDLIYPKFCLGCQKEGFFLCADCFAKLAVQPQEICPVCKAADDQRQCPGSPLDHLWTLARYQENLIAELIQKIKYGYLTELVSEAWARPIKNFWQKNNSLISRQAILVPVPLHRRRLLGRGFNQSELIALELSKISGLAVAANLLRRKIRSEPQVGLSGERRQENIKGIFQVDYRAKSQFWDRELILVDDVFTTGSTISECARTLRLAGFKKVSGLVLAVD